MIIIIIIHTIIIIIITIVSTDMILVVNIIITFFAFIRIIVFMFGIYRSSITDVTHYRNLSRMLTGMRRTMRKQKYNTCCVALF